MVYFLNTQFGPYRVLIKHGLSSLQPPFSYNTVLLRDYTVINRLIATRNYYVTTPNRRITCTRTLYVRVLVEELWLQANRGEFSMTTLYHLEETSLKNPTSALESVCCCLCNCGDVTSEWFTYAFTLRNVLHTYPEGWLCFTSYFACIRDEELLQECSVVWTPQM